MARQNPLYSDITSSSILCIMTNIPLKSIFGEKFRHGQLHTHPPFRGTQYPMYHTRKVCAQSASIWHLFISDQINFDSTFGIPFNYFRPVWNRIYYKVLKFKSAPDPLTGTPFTTCQQVVTRQEARIHSGLFMGVKLASMDRIFILK